MASKLITWSTAHVSGYGEAISEVIQFEGDRAFCRIITHSSQFLYVWLPLSSVVVTRHMTWSAA
jgi:hypothetical protein